MDTTILRIIIAIIGVFVVLGIYLWDYFSRKRHAHKEFQADDAELRGEPNFIDDDSEQGDSFGFDSPDVLSEGERERLAPMTEEELLSYNSNSLNPRDEKSAVVPVSITTKEESPVETKVDVSTTVNDSIILFSLVPKHAEYFSGDILLKSLTAVGLECGERGIFHRVHEREGTRHEIFSVASLVEPGTFPVGDMNDFKCPGITLFLQIDAVPDALEAFDDLTDTGHDLVFRLFGKLLDAKRQEVTMADIIEPIRESLIARTSSNNS